MNAARRKETNRIKDAIDALKQDVVTLQDAEQEAFDSLPESFQAGEKGDKAQTAINALEQVVSSFEEIESSLDEAAE